MTFRPLSKEQGCSTMAKMGRPTKIPRNAKALAAMKAEIRRMAVIGLKDDEIAKIKGMGESTLKDHFASELSNARTEAKDTILRTAYEMAVIDRSVPMTIFLCKTRCGLSELKNSTNENQAANSISLTLNTTDPVEAARVYEEIMRNS